MIIKNAERVGIFGKSGSGKSTRAKQMLHSEQRLVIFDTMGEYGEEGVYQVHSLAQLKQYLAENWRQFKVAYVPPYATRVEALHKLSVMLRGLQQPYINNVPGAQKMTLMVEELNGCFPVSGLTANLMGFADLCGRGRHFGIGLIGISQRFAAVHNDFRANMSESYFFGQDNSADIRTIQGMVGQEVIDKMMSFQPHEFFKRRAGNVEYGKNELW
ncbi:MAG: DUF87 domain-containing protein [Magnetococcales bacterium]|nr:DUF87 domain-containing protein [Magnetococcales bacterium]